MAVITKLSHADIAAIISQYDIKDFVVAEEILEGVENTNYLIKTKAQKYILTLFEKRVSRQDIPFFLNLKEHLANKGIQVPQVIANKLGNKTFAYNAKTGAILSFLAGRPEMNNIGLEAAALFGDLIGRLHLAGASFNAKRDNDYGFIGCKKLLQELVIRRVLSDDDQEFVNNIFIQEFGHNFDFEEGFKRGIIHGDLFPDNIFFLHDKISGVIDFYFAAYDYLIYDLAIAVSAWCFDNEIRFNKERALAILNSYNKIRPLTKMERQYFRDFCLLASCRFFLTRSFDYFFGTRNANIKLKDPAEFKARVNFFLRWSGIRL